MASDYSNLPPEEQQEKWLDEATAVVKQQAFFMKRALDGSNTRDALKYSSNMLCELRTSVLSPKNYYELYMLVFDELRHLEFYFQQEFKKGRKMVELYELVQHAGNILPRLYLLCTVGSVYIKSKECPAKDILKDLVEMCRGVQQPMRGLFLRNYLLQLSKDKLPDIGSDYEGTGGTVRDSIEFVLLNFAEMNKLWVRMQHQGPVRDREKREKERLDLRILVGTNLVRLSQLEGVDQSLYQEIVLPRIIEQVLNCKDQIAQQYLMECIIQVFPDELHLVTLEALLNACTQLQQGVDVRGVMVALMDRLADFAKRSPDLIPEDLNIFQLFCSYVAKMTQGSSLDLAGILTLQVALLNFAIRFAPGQMDYIDQILGFATRTLQQNSVKRVEDTVSTKAITQLLTMPLDTFSDVLSILDLSAYPDLMSFLPYSARKSVSLSTVRNLQKFNCKLADNDKVEKLFGFIQPIVKDESDQPDDDEDKDEFEEEQNLVAPLVQLFDNENSDVLFKMYCTARRHFGQGGTARIKHTLPPLIFCALQLARRIRLAEFEAQNEERTLEITVPSKKLFAFVLETVTALGSNAPELALRLFLQCAQEANNCRYETIAYEFVTQAFLLYEDEISDSKVQEGLIGVFVGSLSQMKYLGEDEYDTLITKTTQYSAKLLKKPEQCRAIYRCAHLFWNNQNGYKDGKRVLECLQRSLKIADVCMQSAMHANLFVEILNEYLYYFAQENEHVQAKYIQGLIDLIKEHIANMEEGADREAVLAHYKNTLQHIARKKAEDERYAEININV